MKREVVVSLARLRTLHWLWVVSLVLTIAGCALIEMSYRKQLAACECTTDTDCMEQYGGFGDPEPRRSP